MIINPYLVQPSGPAYGTLTTAWIAATGETDLTILGALNTLESNLTTYGLTSKMKALYPMVGGSSTKHSYNFMNTSQYQLTFNGGWTHSSTGALPNGTNAYANTYFPATNLTIDSNHLTYYSRTQNSSTNSIAIGNNYSAEDELYMSLYYSAVSIKFFLTGSYGYNERASVNIPNTLGFHIGTQTAINLRKLYFAGSLVATNTISNSVIRSANSIYIGALNNSNSAILFTPHECALSSIGDGLNDTEAANLYTAVQTFQTSLTRQI